MAGQRGRAATALRRLEATRLDTGAEVAPLRLALLDTLAHAPCASAGALRRLHEMLCFLRAYPGEAAVLAQVESMLAAFAARRDLKRRAEALADSGIAGTAIRYRFFGGQAQWLAAHWPDRLRLDRSDTDAEARIAAALPPLLTATEADALLETKPGGYAALDRLRGDTTDATFLLRRLAAQPLPSLLRETLSDSIDATYVLEPGPDTPVRTTAWFAPAPLNPTDAPLRGRPDLQQEIRRAPRAIRRLGVHDGSALADLAQAAMVTRARSLEAFSYADPRDTWLVDDGDGLAFGFLGMQPERRHALAVLVGGLTLRNRVPIGYLEADIVGRSAALSFNTFETFRGLEASGTFARWLAALHHAYGSTSFTIEPYQLGHGNAEGLASGAFWFYWKLGFRPRRRALIAAAEAEAARLARRPGARTPPERLLELASEHLFFDLDPRRPHPLPQPAALGLTAGERLSTRFGADREAAVEQAALELLRHCALKGWTGFTRDERRAWERLAPIVALLDVQTWSEEERQSLATLIRAKGRRSERDHVERVVAHPRFEAALLVAGRHAAAKR